MRWEELTHKQREAAESEVALTLVTGSAGTGKTTCALWAARKALESPHAEPWQRALFLTFSRTAVEQIASRSSRVGGLDDRIEISTFHSFAMRTLRAFGAFNGRGRATPALQSEAHKKLFGAYPDLLTYDDLVPAALEILGSGSRLRALAADRWPVVICDEFQDTSTEQWKLLTLLGETARLILLADPHQMIYTFVPGVGPERLRWARENAELAIELEEASHRDPSGIIPAMASAVRRRAFDDPAVAHAVETEALRVVCSTDETLLRDAVEQLRTFRESGSRSVGIYGHSNEGVARLGAALTSAGVRHTLVGIPEAQGEGLSALLTLTKLGLGGATEKETRIALAVFLTACVRGRSAPGLAFSLAFGHDLPPLFERSLTAVLDSLRDSGGGGISAVANAASRAWEELGVTAGVAPWRRASYGFLAAARRLTELGLQSTEALEILERDMTSLRTGALIADPPMATSRTTLMNFHQTKGREADAVLLVYRSRDYLADAHDEEPFTTASRVLYVSLTRARKRVAIIIPPDPHPLIAPFAAFL